MPVLKAYYPSLILGAVPTHTRFHLIKPNVHIVIPVCAGLLMIKSKGMKKLMLNHSLVVTAWSQR